MKVLLDECVPRRFRDALPGIQVSTARDQRWTSLRNGDLLSEMRGAGFTTLVTVDRNLTFQQHIAASGIAVIVMHAVTNRLSDLVPLGPRVVEAITGDASRRNCARGFLTTGCSRKPSHGVLAALPLLDPAATEPESWGGHVSHSRTHSVRWLTTL